MRSEQVFQYCLIDAELTAGITFCRAAETSQDPSRRASNMEQAECAFHAALDFTSRARLAQALQGAIDSKTDYLRYLLSGNRKQRATFKLELPQRRSKRRKAS